MRFFTYNQWKKYFKLLRLILIQLFIIVILFELFKGPLFNGWQYIYQKYKDDNKFYVYAVGASTMGGYPYSYRNSIANIVKESFGGYIDGKEIVVVKAGDWGGELAQHYHYLFMELSLRPHKNGVIFIYSGINENILNKGPDKFFSVWRVLNKSLFFSVIHTYICRNFLDKYDLLGKSFFSFSRNSFQKYQYFYEKVIQLAKKKNIPIIASTLSGNFSGFRPVKEIEVSDDKHKLWIKYFVQIKTYIASGNTKKAITLINILKDEFKSFIKEGKRVEDFFTLREQDMFFSDNMDLINRLLLERNFASAVLEITELIKYLENKGFFEESEIYAKEVALTYLFGKKALCLEALGEYDKAFHCYKKAIPAIYPSMLPRPKLSQIITSLCEKYNTPFINSENILRSNSSNGLLNYELFADGHHPNRLGQLLLGRGFAGEMAKIFKGNFCKPLSISDLGCRYADELLALLRNVVWISSPAYANVENLNMCLIYLDQMTKLLES